MRARLLILAAGVVLAACAQGSVNSGVTYQTYQYSCCAHDLVTTTWHPGNHLSIVWTAKAARTTSDATTHQIALRAKLIGPFATVNALKQAIGQGSMPAGVRSIDAQAINVDDRTGAAATSAIDLPADAPRGFYNLETKVVMNNIVATGGAVIVVE